MNKAFTKELPKIICIPIFTKANKTKVKTVQKQNLQKFEKYKS